MKGESRIVWTVIVVAVLLILAIDRAQAAQFEVGAGVARADTHGNGTWYQEGFPHTLRLTQPIWSGHAALVVGYTFGGAE